MEIFLILYFEKDDRIWVESRGGRREEAAVSVKVDRQHIPA